MPGRFLNKYRNDTTRAPWWDYGSNGIYFVTICTRGRNHYFGEIENDQIVLTPIGLSANDCWYAIPDHFPFVKLGEFVVMPNHVHGIIIIDKKQKAELPKPGNRFGPQSQNLASIIRGYKIGVTKSAKTIQSEFGWQSRYYDHIIRDEESLTRISNYIENNIHSWNSDKFNDTFITQKNKSNNDYANEWAV
jgi:REP element-mobilizing transposase RayT